MVLQTQEIAQGLLDRRHDVAVLTVPKKIAPIVTERQIVMAATSNANDLMSAVKSAFTPAGFKMFTRILSDPTMTGGGKTNFVDSMYAAYKTQVAQQQAGGGKKNAKKGNVEMPSLSKPGAKALRTFLTSRRVLRGGDTVADTFLKFVSPYGYQQIKTCVGGMRGGGTDTGRSVMDVMFKSSLPAPESINFQPVPAKVTTSVEMLKLNDIISNASTRVPLNAGTNGSTTNFVTDSSRFGF
jgi:hypothetical protein